jgi:hypothetical protein
MKSSSNKSLNHLVILFLILIAVGFLYKRYTDKQTREENYDTNKSIQNYLLDDITLGKSKKPILWIHIPYEYNSRDWLNFGSRSSFDLNQPYLYLTIRSIIKNCDESFTICIIDDASFKKLIPNWNINMTRISDPILSNMRMFGLMKLLQRYGGLICPLSFVCIKDLIGLYEKGTRDDKMFLCEMVDRNITSTDIDFYPNLSFCGAPRECETVRELCNYLQRIISHDYTADTRFLGSFDKWCNERVHNGTIRLIDGHEVGTKTIDDEQIILDDLMSNHFLKLYKGTYGIYIPADELLNRVKYGWFIRMSSKQVLESDTIIGNYLLLTNAPDSHQGILEPLQPSINKTIENKFVSFWKVPSDAPNYGLKPNFLGDNVNKLKFPGR